MRRKRDAPQGPPYFAIGKIMNISRITYHVSLILMAFCLMTGVCQEVFADQRRMEAKFEEPSTQAGNPIYLNITFFGDQTAERPQMNPVDGLQIRYVGPSTRVSIVNGRVSQSVTHSFLVIPTKEGVFQVGPFKTSVNGEVFMAPPVSLTVEGGSYPPASSGGPVRTGSAPVRSSAAPPSGQSGGASPDASQRKAYESDRVFLTMDVGRRKIYVNEIVPLTIKLYGTGVGLKDIEYPMYGHDGFSAGDFPEPEKGRELFHGMDYNTLVFKQDISGIRPGECTLGPAKLNCTMLVRRESPRRNSSFGRSIFDDDFFGSVIRGYQEFPIELSTQPIHMTILPLPNEGKPSDFQGAVGNYGFDVETDVKTVKIGDPITVRMIVSGDGNLDTVTAPSIQESEDFKVYEPQSSKKDNKKVYEQVIIPKSVNVKEIPKVSFSYFSPLFGAYKTISKGPIPISVTSRPEGEAPVKMVSASQAGTGGDVTGKVSYQEEKLGKDIIYMKEYPGTFVPEGRYLFQNKLFWISQMFPIGLFLTLFFFHRKSEKIRTDKKYARFLKAPRKARIGMAKAKSLIGKKVPVQFYDVIFKTLQEYIGDKFNLPKGAVTSQVIDEKFRPAGYDEEVLGDLKEMFDACEMARYASVIPDAQKEEEVLEKLKEIIDHLEKSKV